MTTRRTTLAADRDDLAVLELEARRRGVPLVRVFRELVAREADALRQARRPRIGVARSRDGASQVAASDEHAPMRPRAPNEPAHYSSLRLLPA